jgi:thiamine-phosphate pyrophosphorylase
LPTLWTTKYQLHLVTEPRRAPEQLVRAVELALHGGIDWVQLRDKSASAAALSAQASQLLALTREHAAHLAINDRLDVALAVGAEGVHLAGQSLSVEAAVRVAGGRLFVGRSVHGLGEAVDAAADGADYVTFGHVFPTTTHPGLPPSPRSLDELRAIVDAVDVPVLAIGGITVDNLDSVLATGCAGVAVISAILSAADPRQATAKLRAALERSSHVPRVPFPDSEKARHAPDHQPTAV